MRFFTDQKWWVYLLINIKKYPKMRSYQRYNEIIIDPGVYDLKDNDKYSWEGKIDIDKFLEKLPENHFFSFDYPSDMNLKFEDLFIKKSWKNALKYSHYSQYITTVQGKFGNINNYIKWFERYNELDSDFMGLGNMCQHRTLNRFLKDVLSYIFKNCNSKRIHIYGLCKKAIPYADKLAKKYKKLLSVDQEKWQYYKVSSLRSKDLNYYLNDLIKKEVEIE